MINNKYITNSDEETRDLGEKIGRDILKKVGRTETGQIIALKGDLGAGKTTFMQGVAKGLGIKKKILSPTFSLMKKFKINSNPKSFLYHFDCYRFESEKEVLDLGFEEIISNLNNIIFIEWPEKIKGVLPKNIINIIFKNLSENIRELEISGL